MNSNPGGVKRKRFVHETAAAPQEYVPKYRVPAKTDERPKVEAVVADLKPGSKNLSMLVIVLDISKMNLTKDQHEIRTLKVADKSGSINLSLWDKPGTLLQPGDIIRINKAYSNVFKNSLTLYIGKGGELQKVGDFCLVFNETPNMSEIPMLNSGPGPGPGGAEESKNQPPKKTM